MTELVARPLLNLHWPELAGVVQPLAGEYAGRRALLERMPFVSGYGVEIAMLVDVLERRARRHGAGRPRRARAPQLRQTTRWAGWRARSTSRCCPGWSATAAHCSPSEPSAPTLTQFVRDGGAFVPPGIDVARRRATADGDGRGPARAGPGRPA